MFDPISIFAGAAVFSAGMFVGRRNRSAPRASKPITATCECNHSLSMHDKKTGICHERVYRSLDWHPCSCRHYVGPQPIESMFALPILPPDANP